MAGYYFEYMAHSCILDKITFQSRNLKSGVESEFCLENLHRTNFGSLEDINDLVVDTYWVPSSEYFATFDSFVKVKSGGCAYEGPHSQSRSSGTEEGKRAVAP